MGTSRRKLAGILLKETLILSVSGGAAGVLMGLLVVIPFSGLIETGTETAFPSSRDQGNGMAGVCRDGGHLPGGPRGIGICCAAPIPCRSRDDFKGG